jgi:hypothetical protein
MMTPSTTTTPTAIIRLQILAALILIFEALCDFSKDICTFFS